MRHYGKIIASFFMTGMVLISGILPTSAHTGKQDAATVMEINSRGENGTDSPRRYAMSGGTWEKNSDGVWMYRDSTNQIVRNCWVLDQDMLFFVGYDGCIVKNNYSSDGFYCGENGAWDSTRTQRTWDVDPYEGAYEGNGNIWIFKLTNTGGTQKVQIAYMQTGEVYMTCTLTPVGHGCYMAWPENSGDVTTQMLIAVSDDKNTVRISSGGQTHVCTYTPNSYYYDPNNTQNGPANNQYNNNYNNGYSDGYNDGYNSGYYNSIQQNQGYNAAYEFVFPYSSTNLISEFDAQILSDYELRIALNEIYARHGRRFKDKELQNYFNSTSWYVGMYESAEFDKIQDGLLNDIEKKNINILVKERNRRK